MASFDIRLLYTSIPPQETMDMCVLKLFEEKNCINDFLKDSFSNMLITGMNDSFALFDSLYYKQRHGIAMSSWLGLTFAIISLCVHEILCLKKL